MATIDNGAAGRTRLNLDVDAALLDRMRQAAMEREMTVEEFILVTIERRVRDAASDVHAAPLTTATDPVLAELWNSPRDAAYDDL